MSDNDIKYEKEVTKLDFDMIITIMLHDACHDFDNDKSNAAFKEYFFSNKAVPSPSSSAISRLQKISSAVVPPPGTAGGGGFMKGGMIGVSPLVIKPSPHTPQSGST